MDGSSLGLQAGEAKKDDDRRKVFGNGAFKSVTETTIAGRAGRDGPAAAQEFWKYVVIRSATTLATIGAKYFQGQTRIKRLVVENSDTEMGTAICRYSTTSLNIALKPLSRARQSSGEPTGT